MRTLLFFLLWVLCLAGTAGAQLHPFVPVGTEWWYEQDEFFVPPGGPYQNLVYITANRDTVFATLDTGIVARACLYENTAGGPVATYCEESILATDSQKVYIWNGNTWAMVFDYSLEAGDTLEYDTPVPASFGFLDEEMCDHVLLAADTITVGDSAVVYHNLARIPDSPSGCSNVAGVMSYARHLGPLSYFIIHNNIADPPFGGYLRCFSHPLIGMYPNGADSITCWHFDPFVGAGEAASLSASNPIVLCQDNRIVIRYPSCALPARFKIFNAVGGEVLQNENPNGQYEAVFEMSAGVYILRTVYLDGSSGFLRFFKF